MKLQTSHIASMYFETWMDKKKREDMCLHDDSQKWLTQMKQMSDRELRSYLDLITLSCVLLASKVNE